MCALVVQKPILKREFDNKLKFIAGRIWTAEERKQLKEMISNREYISGLINI